MPYSHPLNGSLEDWELEAVRREVRKTLNGGGPFLAHDLDDLMQECVVHWLLRRGRYDPSGGASVLAFLKVCVRNYLKDLRRREQREREAGPKSLSVTIGDDDAAPELWETVAVVGEGGDVEASVVAAFQAEAVAHAMQRLTKADRDVVVGLGSADSLSDLSRRTGRSRQSLYRVIERVRAVFRAEGLDEFLR